MNWIFQVVCPVEALGRSGVLPDKRIEDRLREEVMQAGKVHRGQSPERLEDVLVVLVQQGPESLASGRSSTGLRSGRRRRARSSRARGRAVRRRSRTWRTSYNGNRLKAERLNAREAGCRTEIKKSPAHRQGKSDKSYANVQAARVLVVHGRDRLRSHQGLPDRVTVSSTRDRA